MPAGTADKSCRRRNNELPNRSKLRGISYINNQAVASNGVLNPKGNKS